MATYTVSDGDITLEIRAVSPEQAALLAARQIREVEDLTAIQQMSAYWYAYDVSDSTTNYVIYGVLDGISPECLDDDHTWEFDSRDEIVITNRCKSCDLWRFTTTMAHHPEERIKTRTYRIAEYGYY